MAVAKRKILIAQKEEKELIELKNYFRNQEFYVYSALDGKRALDIFFSNNHEIDIMIVDQGLECYSGIELIKIIRDYAEVPILLLAEKFSENELIEALNHGADHYITKPLKLNVLKAFVDKVLRGRNTDKDTQIIHGDLRIDQSAQKVYINDRDLNLTPKEYALVHYFATHKNILLTREAILDAVWGYDYQGDIRTVDTLIKQLRKKITADYPYIQSVYGIGYRFVEILSEDTEDKLSDKQTSD